MPTQQSIRRVAVVTEFLKAGIPLSKIDNLRQLLEDGSERLTDSSYMASYILVAMETEMQGIMEELNEKPHISVIFDGSTYQCEALVVIVQYIADDFKIRQRLVSVRVLAKRVTFQQLAREVITVLSAQLQYPSNKVIAVTQDGASVNGAAVSYLKDIMYPQVFDITCIAHSLDNVGKRFDTVLLNSFLHSWVSLFTHSPTSRIAWREHTGEAISPIAQLDGGVGGKCPSSFTSLFTSSQPFYSRWSPHQLHVPTCCVF